MSNSTSLIQKTRTSAENLGTAQFTHFVARRFLNRISRPTQPYRLYSKYSRVPLWLRPNTSDLDVFDQIFRYREYRCLDPIRDARLIIDCGANIGFASAYLLSRFPDAQLIAVEPDAMNFLALNRNLAPFARRVSTLCTGVWSHTCGLVLSTDSFGDGREWARTVREARADEVPTMTATDIKSLLHGSNQPRISILKIDIEGSELEVFRNCNGDWLDRVDSIVIELHGKECEQAFFAAIAGRGFEVSTCDELTVCLRPRPVR